MTKCGNCLQDMDKVNKIPEEFEREVRIEIHEARNRVSVYSDASSRGEESALYWALDLHTKFKREMADELEKANSNDPNTGNYHNDRVATIVVRLRKK